MNNISSAWCGAHFANTGFMERPARASQGTLPALDGGLALPPSALDPGEARLHAEQEVLVLTSIPDEQQLQ